MKRELIIIFFLTPFFIASCGNNTSVPLSGFERWKQIFPDSLTKHFPDSIGKNWISYGSSYRNTPKKMLYLTLLKKLSEDEIVFFKNYTCAPDSCLMKIYLNKNTYGFNKEGLGECESFIPIPDYNLINDEREAPNDTKYYVLETSKKSMINHDLYLRYYLPEEWKNGMSRGIGLSEKENIIFYWLILW